MRRRKDMGSLYDDHMEFFGLGTALFHPCSSADMQPPCVGYLDASRRWNHIANIPFPNDSSVYKSLEKIPQRAADLKIEWRPKTSLGVRQYAVAANAETPDGLPGGAEASVRYASKTNFGAILIAQKPVTLISYNDETLFRHWVNENYSMLAQLHGVELSRYGLWLVTRTYTTPKASINAWLSKDKDAVISVKAKADMMGDLGAEVDWKDKSTDKDWTHHGAAEGVVAFFDGIEIPGWQWYYAGVKARIRKNLGLSRRLTLNREALGPRGSWKPPKRVDPTQPTAAPGADDAWALKSSPVFKENRRFIAEFTEKDPPPADKSADKPAPKTETKDMAFRLSKATTADGNSNNTPNSNSPQEPKNEPSEHDEQAKS